MTRKALEEFRIEKTEELERKLRPECNSNEQIFWKTNMKEIEDFRTEIKEVKNEKRNPDNKK